MNAILKVGAFAAALLIAPSAHATPIDWTDWTDAVVNATSGSASGNAGPVDVSYNGEVQQLVDNYPSWNPTSTFSGGTVDNAPPSSGGIIRIFGGGSVLNTITFSTPVVDPVMAIWSLGQPSIQASFVFGDGQPFTIQSGGPNSEYGGSSITKSGQTVLGREGNGVIQFDGTFSSISWTNPVRENWYGFTVGISGVSDPDVVPAPAALLLIISAFGLLPLIKRQQST